MEVVTFEREGDEGSFKELLLDMVRQASKTACFGNKIGVVLETLLDTPIFGVGADDGRGGRQEGDGQAYGAIGSNGSEVLEDDRTGVEEKRIKEEILHRYPFTRRQS